MEQYHKNLLSALIALSIVLLAVAGCGLANRQKGRSVAPEQRETLQPGLGDAYSFKVRMFRDGKKNTIHFDLYFNGDSLAMFAKGYLGKGVLKGMVVKDSVVAYFPTENEYYAGTLENLVGNRCFERMEFERLILELFARPPTESEAKLEGYYLKIEKDEDDEKKLWLISGECAEELYLQYDVKDNRFIPEEIEYAREDGSFKLYAERTRYKLNISIPAEKFEIPIPEKAGRIIP